MDKGAVHSDKGVDERIDGVLWWFGHDKGMENNRIVKSMLESVLVVLQ